MREFSLLLVLNISFSLFISAQICTVSVPALKGKYFGDCRHGKANGHGTAQGTDTYTGDFKKGLPDGKGKYIWKNGDWYDGEWKNGLYEGDGTLSHADSSHHDSIVIIKGYWEKGKYIGDKRPYYVQSTTVNVGKVKITKQDTTGNEIIIKVETQQAGAAALGYTTNSRLISVDNLEGQYQQKTDYGSTERTTNKYGLKGVKFPYKATLSFETRGTLISHVDTISFGINIKGTWVIEVMINN